jgi:hypothetical protein
MAPPIKLALAFTAAGAAIATAASAQVAKGTGSFTTTLSGAQECNAAGECNKGDPNGAGTATIRVTPSNKEVCWDIEVSNIAPATLAHIHIGAAGTAPPNNIVVNLTAPTDGDSEGCTTVTGQIAAQIFARPQGYYVNVHNAEFPAGAVRGQLPARRS